MNFLFKFQKAICTPAISFLFITFTANPLFSAVDLPGVVQTLQILTGISQNRPPNIVDIDGDENIGLAEAVYLMQVLSGFRQDGSCGCEPLDAPAGEIITVSNAAELMNACNLANSGDGSMTVMIEDGIYQLDRSLNVTKDDITFRSVSGDRDDVILKGSGMNGTVSHVFNVSGKHFTVADLTLGWVFYHGVQIHGEHDADHALIHNVRFADINEQMLKVSVSDNGLSGDDGVVECSLFEYTAGIGPQFYIGGVDCHRGKNWIIRNNEFRHIRSPEENLGEHAVHFWNDSGNTLVEDNVIVNCDRGIGFGLGSSSHDGGMIRNNMVYTSRDVGIGLENASNVNVYNNTVYSKNYPRSIEYRFSGTMGGEIANNLTTGSIISRDSGSANTYANYENADTGIFINPGNGDLHLMNASAGIVDSGALLDDVARDIDCDARPQGQAPDIGADEYR